MKAGRNVKYIVIKRATTQVSGVCHQTQMTCTCGLKRSFNHEAAEVDISQFKVQPKLGRPFCIPAFCRRSCRRRGLGAGYCNPQKTCVCAI
jgi:hypothetical protein